MKYVCIFMIAVILCTLCGGLFGISASGTFTETLSKFYGTVVSLNNGLIEPLTDFLSFFGLNSYYGGDAIGYKLEDGDVINNLLIPADACYAFLIPGSSCSSDNKAVTNELYSIVLWAFFDDEGKPLACYPFKDGKLIADNFPLLFVIDSFDFSGSFYNPLSKYVYIDLLVKCHVGNSSESVTYSIYCDTALYEYKYSGNFTDLQKKGLFK